MNNNYETLAPCGVYCGACPSFKKTCNGCASNDTYQSRCSKWGCKIRNCCYNEKGLDFCANCNEFPCKIINKKLLSTHQDDPRFAYRHEIPAVFVRLKTMGLAEYFEFQKQRWKCKNCGGIIHFYYYKCKNCGKEQMVK